MPKTQFPKVQKAVAAMTHKQRTTTAQALIETAQPVLHALAAELLHANLVEVADLAVLDAELRDAHQERIARETAGLPDPPANDA